MIDIYLFDWGDTLMIDFPGVPGKMCDWIIVEALDGAQETLEYLSKCAQIYIATGAAESTEMEIEQAFKRVGLSQYISGYFCKAGLGISKGSPEFLPAILSELGISADRIAMVGDDLLKDIEPAAAVGIKPVWLFRGGNNAVSPSGTKIIENLRELCV
jgi:putative hydrolase of the HAD superfamily